MDVGARGTEIAKVVAEMARNSNFMPVSVIYSRKSNIKQAYLKNQNKKVVNITKLRYVIERKERRSAFWSQCEFGERNDQTEICRKSKLVRPLECCWRENVVEMRRIICEKEMGNETVQIPQQDSRRRARGDAMKAHGDLVRGRQAYCFEEYRISMQNTCAK